jgi:hypothetical protein
LEPFFALADFADVARCARSILFFSDSRKPRLGDALATLPRVAILAASLRAAFMLVAFARFFPTS